ncbi:hypothetical protein EBR96_04750 [bacterium]|nr:hypothetical protein [bacterium]
MRLFFLGLLVGLFVAAGTYSVQAGYAYRGKRIAVVAGNQVLTPTETSEAIMDLHERMDGLQSELTRTRQENQRLKEDLTELKENVTQFKNLYFRRF